MKILEEFGKLINSEASLADKSSQCARLEFFFPTRDAEMASIRVVKNSVPPLSSGRGRSRLS